MWEDLPPEPSRGLYSSSEKSYHKAKPCLTWLAPVVVEPFGLYFGVRASEEWWGQGWERVVSGCSGEGDIYYHHSELQNSVWVRPVGSQSLLHVKILWGAL